MKSFLFLLLFSFLLSSAGFGQSVIKETLPIQSTILGKEVQYSIYLPDGYDRTNRIYPVLYLLHGYGDDETGWTQFGEVEHIADKAIADGTATPMIIAMPDGGVTWYLNTFDGKVKYEDFFIKEFIPHIDKTYRTRASKQYRAIAGLSMGGYGSLLQATKHPDMFSSCSALSSGVFTDDEIASASDNVWSMLSSLYGKKELTGKNRLTPHYQENSIISIVNNGNAEALSKVRYYLDCGDKDFLIKGNMALHAAMIDKKIPHEFRVREGVHSWSYWRSALPEVLKFASVSFHQQ
ncbi:alpha/beta hydrolase-fold protein [Chryseolinea sp. T2]|uniref:alpha/beta hydrolase n=1 Tax=Chryseolinea sp. T2 TaxID=3129255 RepID=UPI00307815EB